MNPATLSPCQTERELVMTRLLNAPRELVFQVWTDFRHIAQWWGPVGFTGTVSQMDVRPGGRWELVMHGPDGVDYPNDAVYHEVEPPKRLVYSHRPDTVHKLSGFRVTVTFEERGQQTFLTLHMLFETPGEREKMAEFGAIEGGNSTLDSLESYLDTL